MALASSTKSPSVRNGVIITILTATLFLSIALYAIPQYRWWSGKTASKQIVQSSMTSIDHIQSSDQSPLIEGEPYHDPDPFCNISSDSTVKYPNRFPPDLTVEQIIAKRSEPIENIPMCPGSDAVNYDQYKDLIAKLPPNYVQYSNRCQINAIGRGKRQFGGLPSGDPILTNLSTQIAFLHVYKSGGTTVRDTINAILPGLKRTTWHHFKKYIVEFMSHLFVFSHVRDPISRAISSFFELHRRNETELMENRMVGMDSFRFMLSMMEDRMRCAMADEDKWMGTSGDAVSDIYFNLHIMPQLFFLTAPSNPWKPYPVNYVGNMTEMIQSTFDIVYHFYWNSSLYLQSTKKSKTLSVKEAWKKWDQNFHHGRDRHNQKYINGGERVASTVGDEALRYQIEVDDLNDDDVRRICELYWMDYICIPFPIPKACNLTDLLLKHYGDDVVYKDCWSYDTINEWNPVFYEMYRNGTLARKKKELEEKARKKHKSKKATLF